MRLRAICNFLLTLSCWLLAGCASDQVTEDNDPYYVQSSGVSAHGEASAAYGHTVGH